MTKIRLNLRKVATIVACLVVTMTFASCDGTNPDDKNGGGKIDSKIVGGWTSTDGLYAYSFKSDGTCVITNFFMGAMSGAEGKYYTSNGKVYLTNLIEAYSQQPLKDKVSNYSFGSDQYGEYLMIKFFSFTDNNPDSSETYKFYKQT